MYIAAPLQMKAAETAAVNKGQTWYGLMENAGRTAAEEIISHAAGLERVLVLCGSGNNGGDGYVIARYLSEQGAEIIVGRADSEPEGVAGEMLEKIRCNDRISIVPYCEVDTEGEYDVIVDAVFGTGFHGELSDEIGELFDGLRKNSALKAAVDVPSGIDCITGGAAKNTLSCDFTVTFGAVKLGMTIPPARELCGEIIVSPIGIDEECLQMAGAAVRINDEIAFKEIKERNELSHKGDFGRLLIIAGSEGMSGAAALNVSGALRCGAGIVRLASTKSVIDRVGSGIYECTFVPMSASDRGGISMDNLPAILRAADEADVIAIGSGMMKTRDTDVILNALVKFCGSHNVPLIIDADGLNCLADCIDIIRDANCRAVLTPHIGEMARLLEADKSEIMSDRLSAARRLSELTGAVVAAKGFPTFVCSPDGRTAASYTGNSGLSRGGSGDVLTGVISGIVCANKGERLYESVCSGVYFFGKAADMAADKLSETGMLPSDAAAQLPFALKQIQL